MNHLAHLQYAYRLGHTAAYNGEPMTTQPYPDKRRATDNGVTYSRAYINAWRRGYRAYWRGGEAVQGRLL